MVNQWTGYCARLERFWPWVQDSVLLLQRFVLARIFFFSGLSKLDDWSSTLALFQDEYKVPFLPVAFAAGSAAAVELVFPVFLVLGLGTRLAVLPLLGLTLVIQVTYDHGLEPYLWEASLLTLLSFGAGRFALPRLWKRCGALGSKSFRRHA